MIFITGGAYQGKTEFAETKFGFAQQDIFICTDETIDFSKPCIVRMEVFAREAVRQGKDPVQILRENRGAWEHSVFICRDISGGVVPMEAELRRWRDETGRMCRYLACEAESVYRIFCGLEQRLK